MSPSRMDHNRADLGLVPREEESPGLHPVSGSLGTLTCQSGCLGMSTCLLALPQLSPQVDRDSARTRLEGYLCLLLAGHLVKPGELASCSEDPSPQ